jgi:phosphoserine phosphatase RsbU/P
LLALVMILFSTVLSMLLSRNLSSPLLSLSVTAQKLGKGNLDVQIAEKGPREVQELAHTFNVMTASLRDHIRNLKEEVRQREQFESEMHIAAEIQRSILPASSPPSRDGLHLSARTMFASEVGGDFYDVLQVQGGNLAIAIGDATGKGLPAALLVSACASTLRALSDGFPSPRDLLYQTNRALARQVGSTGRFVTAFVMIIDPEKGILRYSIAGHNPPILVGKSSDRQVSLDSNLGLPLGIREDEPFDEVEVPLMAGDTILLYTDGLTEAMNESGRLYGQERLYALLSKYRNLLPEELLGAIEDDLRDYCGDVKLHDDTTIVAIRFDPES